MSTTTIDAHELTVVHELKMSTVELGWMAKGLLAAAGKDADTHGVLCHATIEAEGLSGVAVATDRYRIHQMNLALRAPVDRVAVVIPHDALVWAAKNSGTFKPKKDALIEPIAVLTLVVPAFPDEQKTPGWVAVIYREWDDDDAPSARFDAPLVKEQYPPMARLIDGVRVAQGGEPSPLQLDFLADARTLQTPLTTPPTIAYTVAETGRPGPALLDFWEGGVLRATALIQPSKNLDDE